MLTSDMARELCWKYSEDDKLNALNKIEEKIKEVSNKGLYRVSLYINDYIPNACKYDKYIGEFFSEYDEYGLTILNFVIDTLRSNGFKTYLGSDYLYIYWCKKEYSKGCD